MIKESWLLVAAAILFSAINSSALEQCFQNAYGHDVQNIREKIIDHAVTTTFSDFPTTTNVAIRIHNDFGGVSLLPFLLKLYGNERQTSLQICFVYGNNEKIKVYVDERCLLNCESSSRQCKYYQIGLFFLEISFCNLEHILRNSFSFVPYLDTLSLNNNKINIIENYAFNDLQCLYELDLSYNQLETIDNLMLPSTLQVLNVSNNQISNWNPDKYLQFNMSRIDLSYNRLNQNLTLTSFNFTNIMDLKLNNNNISAFEWIDSSSPNLKRLHLGHNRLEKFNFSTSYCYKTEDFPMHGSDFVDYNTADNDEELRDYLEVIPNAATRNPLLNSHVCTSGYLINLQDIDISYNNLTESNFHLSKASVLNLDLSFNKFTFTADFITGLPVTIQTLDLSNNNEIKLISGMFSKHVELTVLTLEYLNISDLPKNVFYNLTQLKTLSLAHNRLTTFSFSSLSSVTNLNFLDLSFNQLKRFDSNNVFTFVHLNLNVDHNPWTCEIIHRLRIDLKSDNIFVEPGNSTLTASNHVNGIECEEGKHSIENLGSTNASGLLQLHDYMREVNETIFTENKKLHDIIELNSKTNDPKSLRVEIERKLLALQNNVSLEMQSLWANKSSGDDAFLKLNSSIMESLDNIIKQNYLPNNSSIIDELRNEIEQLRNNFSNFKNIEKSASNQSHTESVEEFKNQLAAINDTLATLSKKSEKKSESTEELNRSILERIESIELKLNAIPVKIPSLLTNESSGDGDKVFFKPNSSLTEFIENIIEQKYKPSNVTLISGLEKEMEYLRNNFTQFKNHIIEKFETLTNLSKKFDQNSMAIDELIKSVSELKLKTNESKITEKVNSFSDSPEFQLSVNRTLIDLSKKIDQNSIAIGELIKSISNQQLKLIAITNSQVNERVNGFFDNSTKSHNRELTEQYNLPSIVAKIQESIESLKHTQEQKTSQTTQVIDSDPSKAHYNSLNHVNEFLWTKLTKNDRDPKPEHTDWPLILLLFIVGIIIILAFIAFLFKYKMKKLKQTVEVSRDEIMLK